MNIGDDLLIMLVLYRVRRTTRKEGSKTRVLFDRTILVDDLSRTCGNLVHIAAEVSG